ncbi:MAG: hypothetical protein HYZ45_10740 [Burkholderiales bacterium]|nr:hypothetical protein [Burkholderiales bacterium]
MSVPSTMQMPSWQAENSWQELCKLALLGTSGRVWPAPKNTEAALAQLLAEIAERSDLNQEQKVLMAAGVLSWGMQVAQLAENDELALPSASAANQGQPPSIAQKYTLRRILQEDLLACLPLWLRHAAQHSVFAPYDDLPRLLEIGRKNVQLRVLLAQVVDQRGRWLAQMNSDWQWLLRDVQGLRIASHWWQDGNVEQRGAWLQEQRAQDAANARQQLQAVWAQEKGPTRAALLASLRVGLQLDDEPFLEAALDDKVWAVRQAASQLLAHLPASQWRIRMRARAQACLRWQGAATQADSSWLGRLAQGMINIVSGTEQGAIAVSLPSEFDAAMRRDSLEEKAQAGKGERASWLQQVLSVVPLAEWVEGQTDSASLLAAFASNEWQDLLWEACERSCLLYRDAALAAQLLAQGRPFSIPLFQLLEASAKRPLLLKILRQMQAEPQRVREQLPRYQDLFDAPDLLLDAEISAQILATLHVGVMASAVEHDSHSLRHWLLQMVVKLDLASLEAWWGALNDWDRSRYATYGTHFLPEKMNQIIAFRRQLQAAFAPEVGADVVA